MLDELRQIVEREHAVDQEQFIVRAAQRALHEALELRGRRSLDLEPDHRAAAAALEHGFERADQVFGLFLDLDFGIADHPEGALPLDRVAREQAADEQRGGLLERDDAHRGGIAALRQADEALDLVGHADQRVHRLAVAAGKLQRDGEAEIGNERERMRRIDRQRRQHRENVTQEIIVEPGLFLLGHVRAIDQDDPLVDQRRAQLAPLLLLVAGQRRHGLADAYELLRRRQTIRALGGDAFAHLPLEAGHAHHEEFVEVVGRDRQKPQPFEQRMALV